MNTIRFTSKEAFVEALEGRRKFWQDFDRRQAREHRAAEQAWLQDARKKLREAVKLDYDGLKAEARKYDSFGLGSPPNCPVLMESKIDKVLAALKLTQGKAFTVDTQGTWSDAHNLLTWDPDAPTSVC